MHGGGLVIEKPAAAPPAVAAPAAPTHVAKPTTRPTSKPTPKATPEPVAQTFRTDAPQIRRPLAGPLAGGVPTIVKPLAHAFESEPLVLSIAPGVVAALLALVTAFSRGRRPEVVPAEVVVFRRELPLQRAA
jgi:hypothetical protein